MTLKNLVIIAGLTLLSACSTPYQKSGFSGGFSDTQLGTNIFRVSFRGNGYTSKDQVIEMTLLRSAELTLDNGFKYFSIADSETSYRHSTFTTPVTANTAGTASSYGNQTNYNSTTTFSGGDTITFAKPSASNTIVCYKEKPQDVFVYDAEFLRNSLSGKYLK